MSAKTRITRHLEDYAPYYFVAGVCVVFTIGMPVLFGLASRYPNSWVFRVRPTPNNAVTRMQKGIIRGIRDFGR